MIRPPYITGKTEAEKIEQIIKYLQLLSRELQRLQVEGNK